MEISVDTQQSVEAERLYLSILIANTDILKQVFPVLDANLFTTPYSKRLCRWVIGYYEANKKAPHDNINALFVEKRKEIHDAEEMTHIRMVLQKMNDSWASYEHHDTNYTVEQIIKFLTEQKLRNTAEQMLVSLNAGNTENAEHILGNYRPIVLNNGNNFDLSKDTQKIIEAMKPNASKLFRIGGVLGDALGWFNRGEVSVCMGPTKSGKSFLMLHIAMEAMFQGMKILYINAELSERMMVGRIWEYVLGQPISLDDGKKNFRYTMLEPTESPTTFTVVHTNVTPVNVLSDMLPKAEEGTVEYLKHIEDVTRPQVQALQQQLLGEVSQNFRMFTTPRNGFTLTGLEQCLDNFRNYENFNPDMVVVDYADLIQIHTKMDDLAKEDYVWRSLGGISQERDIVLLTATQGNRKSADGKKYAASEGVGGAYKKLSHIGKLFCIAYEGEEEEDNIRRVFHSLERDGACSSTEVVVTNCFPISRFASSSQYKSNVNYKGYQ